MCFTVDTINLGGVDALASLDEQLLLLDLRLSSPDRVLAARAAMTAIGVTQSVLLDLVDCLCGDDLDVSHPYAADTRPLLRVVRTA